MDGMDEKQVQEFAKGCMIMLIRAGVPQQQAVQAIQSLASQVMGGGGGGGSKSAGKSASKPKKTGTVNMKPFWTVVILIAIASLICIASGSGAGGNFVSNCSGVC